LGNIGKTGRHYETEGLLFKKRWGEVSVVKTPGMGLHISRGREQPRRGSWTGGTVENIGRRKHIKVDASILEANRNDY